MKPTELFEYLSTLVRDNAMIRAVPTEGLAPTASRLGGMPYATADERWPACASCESELGFVGQIDLRRTRHKLAQKLGLLTFFYCWRCKSWGETPFGAWQARRHPDATDDRAVELFPRQVPDPALRQVALMLSEQKSLPDYRSIESRHPKVRKLLADLRTTAPGEFYDRAVSKLTGRPEARLLSQVWGYPRWVQGEATPKCPACARRMQFVWQIGSEKHANLIFTEFGHLYLFVCTKHIDQFGMVFQCS